MNTIFTTVFNSGEDPFYNLRLKRKVRERVKVSKGKTERNTEVYGGVRRMVISWVRG